MYGKEFPYQTHIVLIFHLSAKMGGFLLLIFYAIDIDYKPADKGFKPMTHRNSTMTPGESDWFRTRSLTQAHVVYSFENLSPFLGGIAYDATFFWYEYY